ncbi:MAG: hypothetical protein WDM96_01370 [Lacunisphaera sp.]
MGKSRAMPKASNPGFTFICGSDDFLVGRLGQERFAAMAAAAGADDFSREIVNGFAGNVDEVEDRGEPFPRCRADRADVRRQARGVAEGREFPRRQRVPAAPRARSSRWRRCRRFSKR